MTATDDLRAEHKGILHMLDVMRALSRHIEAGGTVPAAELTSILDFLKIFADKCHHGKEEGLFFPALEQAGIPKKNGPIGQMLIEHELGRKYIKEMTDALAGEAWNSQAFSVAAENYATLLRSHIQKENTVLFPMGDKILAPELQKKLLQEFEHFEETVMGPGIHSGGRHAIGRRNLQRRAVVLPWRSPDHRA